MEAEWVPPIVNIMQIAKSLAYLLPLFTYLFIYLFVYLFIISRIIFLYKCVFVRCACICL